MKIVVQWLVPPIAIPAGLVVLVIVVTALFRHSFGI
jgi:hypothetical protein